jgi:hypothetical protein
LRVSGRWCAASALLLLGGCELSEVTIASGDPVIIVEAIMRPDLQQQWVLVEQTLTGEQIVTEEEYAIPGVPPDLPILDALVTVANRNLPGDPCGSPVVFTGVPSDPNLEAVAGAYWAPIGCPQMRPGDTLDLRVETQEGPVVTGEMVVAGVNAMYLGIGTDSVLLPGGELGFNRDRDTLRASVDPVSGRALQVDVRRLNVRLGSDRVTTLFLDTNAVTLPGDLVNFFEEDDAGDDVFVPGRDYLLSVIYGDQNYWDFIISANDPFSGRGFRNRLEGGMGVFGSLVASTTPVRILGDLDDPREGVYHMSGTVSGVAVDVDWELYLTRPTDPADFSAFVEGGWVFGGFDGTVDGAFSGDTLRAVLSQLEPRPGMQSVVHSFDLEGVGALDPSFSVSVRDSVGTVVGTLNATR